MAVKRRTKAAKVPTKAVQFKVSLRSIRPQIWRRVVLLDTATLGDLHGVIQESMGWHNCHMHSFLIGDVYYSSPSPFQMDDMENEDGVLLADVVTTPKQKFMYEYDFGDSWEHVIVVEKFLPFDPDATYPVCLGGARACPPEDCGGVPGYASILRALTAEKPTKGQKELLEWFGDGYNPESFDLTVINKRL